MSTQTTASWRPKRSPSSSTGTGFTPHSSDIDGHRFFRFRVSMFANLTTNQTARITAVQFPYCF